VTFADALRRRFRQNDLVARPSRSSACLLLDEEVEAVLAGGRWRSLGAKLTTQPRAADPAAAHCCGAAPTVLALGGALVAFAALGMWGAVLNQEHTRSCSAGGGRIENTTRRRGPAPALRLFLVYGRWTRCSRTRR
jgi:hypothetical protein